MKIINSNELSVQYCYSEKAIKIKIVDDQNLIWNHVAEQNFNFLRTSNKKKGEI